jgi:hypothetical protein
MNSLCLKMAHSPSDASCTYVVHLEVYLGMLSVAKIVTRWWQVQWMEKWWKNTDERKSYVCTYVRMYV